MNMLFFKSGLKKATGLFVALAIIVSFIVPVQAAVLSIGNLAFNSARNKITITLSDYVTVADGVDLSSKILLSTDGAAPSAMPYGSVATLNGTEISIDLSSAIDAEQFYFVIQNGAFVGQTTDIVSQTKFAKSPALVQNGVAIDSTRKIVTFTFDCPIAGYLGDERIEDGSIILARNGTNFNEYIESRRIDVDMAARKITVTLANALSGNSARFKFLAGSLQNAAENVEIVNIRDIVTGPIMAQVQIPQIDTSAGVELSADGESVTIPFTCNIRFTQAAQGNQFRNRIQISRQGAEYYNLNAADTVSISGNKLTINFRYFIEGNANKIRIIGGTIESANGDIATTDMYTPDINTSALQYNAPTYTSVSYNKAHNQVSIKFNREIVATSRTSLTRGIMISRNRGEFEFLSSYDRVEIVNSNTVLVTLSQGLTGEYNRLRVMGGAVKDVNGNVQTYDQTTDYIDLTADTYEPFEYEFRISQDMRTAEIVFDRQIQSAYPYDTDFDYVKQEISLMRSRQGNAYNELTSYDYVTIYGRTLQIVFQSPITNMDVIRINKNALKDAYGAIMENEIKVGPGLNNDKSVFDPNTGVELSADKYTVTFNFKERVYNNMASAASLKYMIRVAYDGETFEDLSSACQLNFESYGTLSITFPTPLTSPEARVKILAGALQNESGDTINEDIITNPLGQVGAKTEILIGGQPVFIASESTSTDTRGNAIYEVTINANKASSALATYAGEASLTINLPKYAYGGKVIANGSVIQQLINKKFTILVSCGGATQIYNAEDLGLDKALANFGLGETMAQSVVVEIGISRVETPYTTDFESKAKQKTFTILTQPTEFTVSFTNVSKTFAITKYDEYSERRFSIKPSNAQNPNLTVVRIETSGKINPVPTKLKMLNGEYYLEARVKNNGVYGVITAQRYFTDTPEWAKNAVNTLASRLVLQNANAGAFRAAEAVSRAEVAEMVTRALGLLTDKSGASKFLDVTLTDWYFPSTSIALENDLIRGYDDSTFRPERKVTRQEVMTIMARVMEYLGEDAYANMTDAEADSILERFNDEGKVANWAKINMAKCVKAQVVKGDDKGNLNPLAPLTRAEMSQLIYNLMIEYDLIPR